MSQRTCFLGQVEQVSYEDIYQDMEVVGEEVFVGAGCSEDQIEQLQCQELQRCLRCSSFSNQPSRRKQLVVPSRLISKIMFSPKVL